MRPALPGGSPGPNARFTRGGMLLLLGAGLAASVTLYLVMTSTVKEMDRLAAEPNNPHDWASDIQDGAASP